MVVDERLLGKHTRSDSQEARPAAAFTPAPTHDDIANRAYQNFLQRGAQHGQDFEDWLTAERELQIHSLSA